MSHAIAALPVSDPHASADPGPAPELAMSEDARASTHDSRDALDTTVTSAESTAATHIAQPMGEDHNQGHARARDAEGAAHGR